MADMPLDDGKLDAAVFYNRKFLPTILGGLLYRSERNLS